ncbi:MAG: glycosyltransferase, partial [Actinomycetota bacterium]
LEAYAAGVPVVAARVGGLPEMVEDDRSGMLVEPEDVEGWSKAIARLSDDYTTERLGEGAHAAWRSSYTPERGLDELESAYRAALERLG